MKMRELADLLKKGGGRMDAIEERLKQVEAVRERLLGSFDGKGDQEKRSFSFGGMLRGMANGGLDNEAAWKGFERERQIGLDARARAMSQGTDSAGGYAVPPQYIAELIPELVAKTVVLAAGATPLTGIGSPVEIPKMASGATAAFINGENTAITPNDPTLGTVNLSPKMAAAITEMSRRLVMLSNPSAEAMVRSDLTGAMARLLDLAALTGDGLSGAPTGILNTITPTALTAVPDFDDLNDLLYALEAADADEGKIAWVMNPRTMNSIRKVRSDSGAGAGTGDYILQRDPSSPSKKTLLGHPVFTTTQLPINLGVGTNESQLVLGNFADLIWALFGGLVVETSTEGGDLFRKHQMGVKIVAEVDFGIRHDESFVAYDEVLA